MNDKEITMQRSIERWKKCSPQAMANDMSKRDISYALIDAKYEIISLWEENQRLKLSIKEAYTNGYYEGLKYEA